MTSVPSSELGVPIAKPLILLGAGFSVPFGGPTANQLSVQLLNSLRGRKERILKTLLESEDYEAAYDRLLDFGCTEEVSTLLKQIAQDFNTWDRYVLNSFQNTPAARIVRHFLIWLNGLIRFSQPDEGLIIASLNQDIVLERMWKTRDSIVGHPLSESDVRYRPRIVGVEDWLASNYDETETRLHLINLDNTGDEHLALRSGVNLLKLHGSFNWQDANGSPVLVTGSEKITQIKNSKICKSNFHLFGSIKDCSSLSVISIGYSFRDEHTNRVLKSVISRSRGGRLCIVDPDAVAIARRLVLSKWNINAMTLVPGTMESVFDAQVDSGNSGPLARTLHGFMQT